MLEVHHPLSNHKIILVASLFVHKSLHYIQLNRWHYIILTGTFLRWFMVLHLPSNVLVCVCVRVCDCVCPRTTCPASRLITEIFGFSLQQAARFQPVQACHLSPHSPLWPRTQPPIWGDSSSLLSHTPEQAHFYAHEHTQSTLNTPPRTVDLSGLSTKINNILRACLEWILSASFYLPLFVIAWIPSAASLSAWNTL